jgi:hypothetical protein
MPNDVLLNFELHQNKSSSPYHKSASCPMQLNFHRPIASISNPLYFGLLTWIINTHLIYITWYLAQSGNPSVFVYHDRQQIFMKHKLSIPVTSFLPSKRSCLPIIIFILIIQWFNRWSNQRLDISPRWKNMTYETAEREVPPKGLILQFPSNASVHIPRAWKPQIIFKNYTI